MIFNDSYILKCEFLADEFQLWAHVLLAMRHGCDAEHNVSEYVDSCVQRLEFEASSRGYSGGRSRRAWGAHSNSTFEHTGD
jgi:hypothetical protein